LNTILRSKEGLPCLQIWKIRRHGFIQP